MPKRTLLLIAAVMASLTFACASDSNKAADTAPAASVADAEAIVGTWSGGTTKITFAGPSNFTWEETRPCGAPPCPVTTKAGTYDLRRGQVYLTVPGQTDKAYHYKLTASPRALNLKAADGTAYQLQ